MKIYRKVAEEFQARAKEMRVTNFHKYEASLSIQNETLMGFEILVKIVTPISHHFISFHAVYFI